ncbi:MAG: hypothetical protein ACI4A3_09175 [Lachnospiraceae bacterium]
MKYSYSMVLIRNRIILLVVTLVFALFVGMWSEETGGSDIYSILGGIECEGKDDLNLLAMGKWLFLLGFFLMITAISLTVYKNMRIFLIYRYGGFPKWWRRYFVSVFSSVCFCFLCAVFVWKVCSDSSAISLWKEVHISFHYLLHLLSVVSMVIVLDLILQSKSAISLFIIAEGIFYVFSVHYQCSWMVLGMFVRSEWHTADGFNGIVAYIVEILVVLFSFAIVPVLWEKGYLERRNWINEKNN